MTLAKIVRIGGVVLLSGFGMLLAVAGVLALIVFTREPLAATPSTTHATIARQECITRHAPIAEEWRQSYHYKSLTGPYWQEARQLGYIGFFQSLRKPCVNCHAPANLLDLADPSATALSARNQLGTECTPNLFENPDGIIPSARSDEAELGVDCVTCHVARRGIMGSGRRSPSEHEVIADPRFQIPVSTSETICQTCHRSTVDAWRKTGLPAQGTTCLDCHMPTISAPSVTGGPERIRRSHRFLADKDDATLQRAVNASLEIGGDRKARLRIVNDRVGHELPSGGNWISVRLEARDGAGQSVGHLTEVFGRDDALIFDVWPFNADKRIAFGDRREVPLSLPDGHGTVEASVRYHDWMHTRRTILTLMEPY